MPGLIRSVILVAVLSAFSGCDKPVDTASASKSPVRQIDTAGLPALGEYAPPLDSGRIEIAGPEGWELVGRTKGYVVRFVASSNDTNPMILVKAEEGAAEPLTRESVVAFASALASDGTAQPVAIGDRVGVLQLKHGKEPNTIDRILERLIFTTVVGDRTYLVELRTRQDRVAEFQDMLFAVIAGMREMGATPAESSEDAAPAKAEDEKAKPTEGEKAKPAEDEKAKPAEDEKAKPAEDEKAKPKGAQKELKEIFE